MKFTLHVFNDPKFSVSYFEFLVKQKLNLDGHSLFHYRTSKKSYPEFDIPIYHSPSFFSIIPNFVLLVRLLKSDKVIIHCLASPWLIFYLALFPCLTKKCYWVVWGKDLYFYRQLNKIRVYHRIYEFFRRMVIKNISNIITDNLGDYQLVKQWYNADGRLFRSFSYPSNLYKGSHVGGVVSGDSNCEGRIVILAGNSADPSNQHYDILELLKPYCDRDIEIVMPLSYGGEKHAREVAELGRQYFGDKFRPLMEQLPFEEYLDLQRRVDIAVFAHNRQQAMGNIISLLGMGKRVYIRSDITTWTSLTEYQLKINDINNFELVKNDQNTREYNEGIIKKVYSPEELKKQWLNIFHA